MDRGAWRATVHGVAKSRARLKQLSTHTYFIKVTQKQWVRTWTYECSCSVAKFCSVLFSVTPWTAARQASLSFSQSLLKLLSIELIPSNPLSIQSVTISIIHYQSDKKAYNVQPFFVLKNCIYEMLFLSPFTPLLCISIHLQYSKCVNRGKKSHCTLFLSVLSESFIINTFTFINKNFKVLFYIIILFYWLAFKGPLKYPRFICEQHSDSMKKGESNIFKLWLRTRPGAAQLG